MVDPETVQPDGEWAPAARERRRVFISHRLADGEVAAKVAEFLESVGAEVYLSEVDAKLQTAVEEEDHHGIVESIREGLEGSSHLLGVISGNTEGSWWVPFEIGIAWPSLGSFPPTSIAQMILEEVERLPSFLRVTRVLEDRRALQDWVAEEFKWKGELPEIPRFPDERTQRVNFRPEI